MRLADLQVLNENQPLQDQIRVLQTNLDLLFTFGQSRVRLGDGTTGTAGENLSGEFVEFTSDATPDTEFTVSTATNGTFQQSEGTIPVGRIILWQDLAGSLYQSPTSGTNWTSSSVFLKCDVASVTFKVFLIK